MQNNTIHICTTDLEKGIDSVPREEIRGLWKKRSQLHNNRSR